MKKSASMCLAAAALLSITVPVWAQGNAPPSGGAGHEPAGAAQGQPSPGAAQDRGGQGQGAQLSPADQQFLREAYSINAGEVELGKLAQQKGTTEQVRDFGQRMVGDHSLGLKELRQFAQKGNFAMPDQLLPQQKQLYDKLSGLTGQAFDKAYIDHMITSHEKAIGLFENESKTGQNAILKDYAQEELPMLRSHEDIAKFDVDHPNL